MDFFHRIIPAAAALLILFGTAACGEVQQSDTDSAQTSAAADTTAAPADTTAAPVFDPDSLPAITLTSADLHDGVWDADISNTNKGSNRSPQLSWQPVEGAACYAVYMVDTSASYWLHWKSLNITSTELAAGAAPETEYIGPYPPSGTHDYEIRVYALKEPAAEEQSQFDNSNVKFAQMAAALDNPAGNVLAYGTLTGSYTRS